MSHVDMLGRFGGADGMKTGFICPSGFNLVASATRGGRTLIAVVLGARNPHVRAEQAADLLGNGFDTPSPAVSTLAALQPYGDGRDTVTDMRLRVCHRQAKGEEDIEAKGKLHSPYLHKRYAPPQVVALSFGLPTGKVPLGFGAIVAETAAAQATLAPAAAAAPAATARAAAAAPAATVPAAEEPEAEVADVPIPTPRPDYTASTAPAKKASAVRRTAKTSQVGG